MAETGGAHRRDPAVRPSKFGAGYTVGGPPSVPPPSPPVQTHAAAPPTASAADALAPGGHAQVQLAERPAASPPAATAVRPDASRNVLALVSLIAAVLFGPFLSPVTLAMALVARAQIRRTGERGAGLALAAIVVSAIFLIIGVVVVAVEYAAST